MLALEALANAPGGLGVSELGRQLQIDKSTAHRLLMTMARRDFVRLTSHSQRYVLGLRLVMLGAVAAANVDLAEIARPHLKGLRDATGEATSLAVLSQGEVLFLARAAVSGVLTVDQGVGTRMPVHCSAHGKALLAGLAERSEANEILAVGAMTRFTPRTITDREELDRHLDLVADRGWALDDEEFTSGLRCLAAPIRDAHGAVIASISIAGPASRVSLERLAEFAESVRKSGQEISQALGWRPTDGPVHPG